MGFLCSIGFHNWSKDCEKCSICGKTRNNMHNWSRDCNKCTQCGIQRSDHHTFSHWYGKKTSPYTIKHHYFTEESVRKCKACGKEEFCRHHDFYETGSSGSIYDSATWYKCRCCGISWIVSYNI